MAIDRRRFMVALTVIVVLVVAYAWIDGGETTPRMIEEPVSGPEKLR